MNIIDKIKLARGLEKQVNALEDGMKTKNATKIYAAIAGAVGLAAQSSLVQNAVLSLVTKHPGISAIAGIVTLIAAIFHNPKQSAQPAQQGNQQ